MEQLRYETTSTEYGEAFRSVRCAKNLLWLLVGLAILAQVGTFVLVQFVGVADEAHTVAAVAPGPAPATAPATAPAPEPTGAAKTWEDLFRWALPATKFLAAALCMLLVVTILLAVQLSLLGRLGGVEGFISSFFWCLILLAMLVPWQQVLKGTMACGALYNYGDLVSAVEKIKTSWGAAEPSAKDLVMYYGRFLAYPIVALVVWIIVQAKFARGYNLMQVPPTITVGAPQKEPQ